MKHAFLIIAHEKFEQLIILLKLLDNVQNDIYVHIDKKVKKPPFEQLKNSIQYSDIFFVDRINVTWGAYSQVLCEMTLLKAAVCRGEYSYIHLLSGVDLPIKTQEYIHRFFYSNYGLQFIDYDYNDFDYRQRCQYFWFFREKLGRRKKMSMKRVIDGALLSRFLVKVQKVIGINRIPKNIEIKKGANWFSITGELARYIVDHEKEWEMVFKYSLCADELFVQTITYNSPFRDKVYTGSHSMMRLIDWERGNPYVFRIEDWTELCNSECIFARKFDMNIDDEIIYKIEKEYGLQGE